MPYSEILKRALVASDSIISRDPRVLKQIRWLSELGWTVDTLGRGGIAPEVTGRHYTMPRRSVIVRALSYLFLPNVTKYRILIESTIPPAIRDGIAEPYDLVLMNEIELLPWFVHHHKSLVRSDGRSHLDLHEYAPSQRVGFAYRFVFKRFRDWLITFIPSSAFSSRSVVAGGIAKLYAKKFGITEPNVIRNCPDFADQQPSPVDPRNIRLTHHGLASVSRRLDLLIDAMANIDERFSLEFMLTGSSDAIEALKRQAKPFGPRVSFREPVDVRDVSVTLNDYDLELIFIPPLTENLRYGLPNKLFEAVQGRIGLVIGESPEMVALIEKVGNGAIVRGWSASDLATTINRLQISDIEEMKRKSDMAAHDLSSESEKHRFGEALGL